MKEIEWNWKCLSFISGISKCLIWETNKKLYSKKWTTQQKINQLKINVYWAWSVVLDFHLLFKLLMVKSQKRYTNGFDYLLIRCASAFNLCYLVHLSQLHIRWPSTGNKNISKTYRKTIQNRNIFIKIFIKLHNHFLIFLHICLSAYAYKISQ